MKKRRRARGRAATAQHLPGVHEQHEINTNKYVGYKWGIFLRAPEIFFKLLKAGGDHFVPLGQIAEVRFGLKSGCDKFFFPHDITAEAVAQQISEREFKDRYGISRTESNGVRIIRAGDGSIHLIEAKYLEPEIHGLMDVTSVELASKELDRSVVVVPTGFSNKDKYAGRYIRWGEREGFHTGSTCRSRVSDNREWYDLTGRRKGEIIWSKLQQYRHVVPYNPNGLTCNCNLYDVFVGDDIDARHLCAVLNSTVVALMKFLFGSQMGREGNQVTEIFDTKMMLIPDPRRATSTVRSGLEEALDSMRLRKAMPLVEVDSTEVEWTGELALADRQQLDATVLQLLGISDAKTRQALQHELYEEITKLYRHIRVAERKMQRFRSETARGGRATAHSIAEEIWESLEAPVPYRTPLDFISKGARLEKLELPAGRARIVKGHMFEPDGVRIGERFLELGDPDRCHFVKELSEIGMTGSISIPVQSMVCQIALGKYRAYGEQITEQLALLASAYTAEEVMQERVVRELWKKIKNSGLSE